MKGTIRIDVAPGELIDKITILEIKAARVRDPQKLANIRRELEALAGARDASIRSSDEIARLTSELRKTNEALWDIEDDIRRCEQRQEFATEFIKLARAVYTTNDLRADLKRQINLALQSDLIEEKSYCVDE